MLSKLPRLILAVSVLCPSLSWAVGLGEIHLNSALNEPLNAEIALVSATPEELISLRAVLASRDTFTRYGIDRPPFLSTIAFKVGKGKDGRDALLVRSNDAIPEPFVTFLVEVNWARGRLVREYTVLLDPPVYTPGEARASAPAVAAPLAAATETARSGAIAREPAAGEPAAPESATAGAAAGESYQVRGGDTLMKVARSVAPGAPGAQLDQTMMALYRGNPRAFDGNINLLRRGSVLRVPGAEEIAALNQSEAVSEVRRQMSAWQGSRAAAGEGRLRLVTPNASGTGSGSGDSGAAASEASALRGRVKDLETQLADSRRLLDVRSAELAALQKKLGTTVTPTPTPKPVTPVDTPVDTPSAVTPPPAAEVTPTPAETPTAAVQPPKPVPKAAVEETSGSWLDWITENWWILAAVIVALLGGLGFAAWKRRQGADDSEFGGLVDTDVHDSRDSTSKMLGVRRGDESFVVEESGRHERPEVRATVAADTGAAKTERAREGKPADDTLSSEAAINLDQGDPLAEADFHMAYGLYDQAADLVRIALEREPDRRDLKLKLLEIYFVWGNKDLFLQSAKDLYASRDRAPAGEWEKILIMGKQICPDEPLFSKSTGSGMGAGALIDLNLEGGENRVDIDLFGDPEGEQSSLQSDVAQDSSSTAATGESPAFGRSPDLDFVLDAPERGSDESPTREMPSRDEPTVESESMEFDASNSPTAAWETAEMRKSIDAKLPPGEQTAELAIDDLGLDLEALEQTGAPSISSLEQTDAPSLSLGRSGLDVTDHPADAPTMVAGLDEHSRKMMEAAENAVRDRDLTELERELEASFIADLEQSTAGTHTAVIGPESAPTVQMPRELPQDMDIASTSRVKAPDFEQMEHLDTESTSRLRALSPDASIDLDLDRLANAFAGSGETVDQPRAAEDVFSSEVFEATDRQKSVDLDVGEPINHGDGGTTRIEAESEADTNKLKSFEGDLPELEPVTMSEVGTKLDLARAYMDMGDPEGARSILEEVAHEGSASQKQEARRLIESLPG